MKSKPKIKFSHTYQKMPFFTKGEGIKTWLISVSKEDLSVLPKEFLDWDTLIAFKNTHYPLGKGHHLILTLFTKDEKGSGEVWTTIRRWIIEKEKYYKKLVGKEVEIAITEEK